MATSIAGVGSGGPPPTARAAPHVLQADGSARAALGLYRLADALGPDLDARDLAADLVVDALGEGSEEVARVLPTLAQRMSP